jgi:hypothetical protein
MQVTQSPHPTLSLSGLVMEQAMSVCGVTSSSAARDLHIQVHVRLVNTGCGASGDFVYTAPIPDSVDEVTFGKDNVVIWRRAGTPA